MRSIWIRFLFHKGFSLDVFAVVYNGQWPSSIVVAAAVVSVVVVAAVAVVVAAVVAVVVAAVVAIVVVAAVVVAAIIRNLIQTDRSAIFGADAGCRCGC